MTAVRGLAVALLIGGALASAPGIVLLGVLVVATDWVSTVWSRRGLREVTYERRLASDRAVWGDLVDLDVSVRNDKLLPLPWLQFADYMAEEVSIADTPLEASERPGLAVLRTTWTMAPFERATRHFDIVADRRGIFRFGPVRRRVADVFARDVSSDEVPLPGILIVRPRTVPVRAASSPLAPFGTRRGRRLQLEDPLFFAGVRPYQRGDPPRRVHHRATARVGRPMSKRYESSTARDVLVALDVQTHDEDYWLLAYDPDLVEGLIVAAASLVREFIVDGAACGLAINAWTGTLSRAAYEPPRSGIAQLARLHDVLGRASVTPSTPFGRVLADLPRQLPVGSLVVALSSRDPAPHIPTLKRLASGGLEVRHVAFGPGSSLASARASQAGLRSTAARLEPDWRSSDALVLAG